jgi:hypothetical protein
MNGEAVEQQEVSMNVSQSSSNDVDMFLPADNTERSGMASVVCELKNLSAAVSSMSVKVDATQDQVSILNKHCFGHSTPGVSNSALPFNAAAAQPAAPPARVVPPSLMPSNDSDNITNNAYEVIVPKLSQLRLDGALRAQADNMADNIGDSLAGACSNNRVLKRGLVRAGGEYAPSNPVPFPQDFVLGLVKKYKLMYEDLDIYNWSQGVISMIEREPNMSIIDKCYH